MNILFSALSLGVLGLVFGTLLGYASKKFEVEVDTKISKIRQVLPGANCGGCGYPGCDAYAEAVGKEEAKSNLCTVGGEDVINKLSQILGVEVQNHDKKTAFVKCNGNCSVAKQKYYLEGVKGCLEASIMVGRGQKGCVFGCLGLGSCVKVCQFGALEIVNGIAKVNMEKCTNCGACIKICPKGLIEDVPYKAKVRVFCNSTLFGKEVKDNCLVGCIGCSICEKNCPTKSIKLTESLAKVDYRTCSQCKVCVTKCPTNAINVV